MVWKGTAPFLNRQTPTGERQRRSNDKCRRPGLVEALRKFSGTWVIDTLEWPLRSHLTRSDRYGIETDPSLAFKSRMSACVLHIHVAEPSWSENWSENERNVDGFRRTFLPLFPNSPDRVSWEGTGNILGDRGFDLDGDLFASDRSPTILSHGFRGLDSSGAIPTRSTGRIQEGNFDLRDEAQNVPCVFIKMRFQCKAQGKSVLGLEAVPEICCRPAVSTYPLTSRGSKDDGSISGVKVPLRKKDKGAGTAETNPDIFSLDMSGGLKRC